MSMTRWPVTRASAGGNFRAAGLGVRTGHRWIMVVLNGPSGPSIIAISVSTVPLSGPIFLTTPDLPGGTMIL
jgi:hypothetical protein